MHNFIKSSVSVFVIKVNWSFFRHVRKPVQHSGPKPVIHITSHHSFCWGKHRCRHCHVALESHQENKGTKSRTCCLESYETISDNRIWTSEVLLRWAVKLSKQQGHKFTASHKGEREQVDLKSPDCWDGIDSVSFKKSKKSKCSTIFEVCLH